MGFINGLGVRSAGFSLLACAILVQSSALAAAPTVAVNPRSAFMRTSNSGESVICAQAGVPLQFERRKLIRVSSALNSLKLKLRTARGKAATALAAEVRRTRDKLRRQTAICGLPANNFEQNVHKATAITSAPVTIESIVYSDQLEDHAGVQGVFFPGPGFYGQLFNDHHWVLTLSSAGQVAITAITIKATDGYYSNAEAWTTTSNRLYGKDLYPIAVRQGRPLNERYNQIIGPLPPGTNRLDLFGQVESLYFNAGEIVVEFDNGTSLNASFHGQAAGSEQAFNPLQKEIDCSDADSGPAYATKAQVSYSVDGQTYRFEDYCISDSIVAEGMCGGAGAVAGKQLVLSHGVCKGSCVDGACTKASSASGDIGGVAAPTIENGREGWVFGFHTGRQRAIEAVYLSNGARLAVLLEGRELVTGDGGQQDVFEPGDYLVSLLLPAGVSRPAHGAITVVFTDGNRFRQLF